LFFDDVKSVESSSRDHTHCATIFMKVRPVEMSTSKQSADKVIGRNETQGKSNRQITFQPVNVLLQFLDRLLSELGAGLSLEWGRKFNSGAQRERQSCALAKEDQLTSLSLTVRVLIWRLYSSTRWLACRQNKFFACQKMEMLRPRGKWLTFSSDTSRDFKLLPTTFNSSSSSMILLQFRVFAYKVANNQ
jgi:hypothetical protein